MERKFNNNTRVIFQEPNGLFEVAGKMISEEEVEKLIQLMPDSQWIVIRWHSPQDYHDVNFHPDGGIVNCEKLSDATLRKIVDGKPLEQEGFNDILNSMNGN